MDLAIPTWEPPTLAIAGSAQRFPVRRVFCMGLNYVDHKNEMGITGEVPPFLFNKAVNHLVPCAAGVVTEIAYPSSTDNYQWECELVVAIGKRGADIAVDRARDHIWGYAVGLDMTRRDLQLWAKANGLPWEIGKDVEESGPVGELVPASTMGHPDSGPLWLKANGVEKQRSDIGMMIVSPPGIIAFISTYYTLEPGDIIMTGTPAGIGPARPGDLIEAGILDLPVLSVRVSA